MEFKVSRVDRILIMKCSVFFQPKHGYGTPMAIQKILFMRGSRWGEGSDPPPPPPPLENSQVIWVSIEIAFGSLTLEKLDPLENGGPH